MMRGCRGPANGGSRRPKRIVISGLACQRQPRGGFDDPEKLYALWRKEADTPAEQRYVEDLSVRVRRHSEKGQVPVFTGRDS